MNRECVRCQALITTFDERYCYCGVVGPFCTTLCRDEFLAGTSEAERRLQLRATNHAERVVEALGLDDFLKRATVEAGAIRGALVQAVGAAFVVGFSAACEDVDVRRTVKKRR